MPWFVTAALVTSAAVGYAIAWLAGTDHELLALATCDAVLPSGVAPGPCPPLGAVPHYRAVDPAIALAVGLAVFVLALAAWRLLLRRSESDGET